MAELTLREALKRLDWNEVLAGELMENRFSEENRAALDDMRRDCPALGDAADAEEDSMHKGTFMPALMAGGAVAVLGALMRMAETHELEAAAKE